MSDSLESSLPAGRSRERYKRLQTQRQALEQLVRIAENLERLNSGLQATVLLGKPSGAVGKNALRFFQGLSETTRTQPTAKLRSAIANLEKRIKDSLQRVLQLADGGGSAGGAYDEEAATLINEFRRASQTAVALRILMRERGETVAACTLPVEQDVLREQIKAVSEREKKCRKQVEEDLEHALENAYALLKENTTPGIVRAALQTSIAQLEENLSHVRAGKSMESLPPTTAPAAEPPAAAAATTSEPQPVAARQERKPARRGGVLGLFKAWLDAPWHVSWRDIKRRQ